MAARAEQSEPSADIVKTDDGPRGDPKVETPPRTPPGPGLGARIGRFFRFLLRLVFLLIALAVIGVALYILLPEFYQRFVRPVEQNTVQVRQLQSWQEQTQQELSELQTNLESLETAQNEQDQRISDMETEITARSESLAALERLQSELEAQNEEVSAELERQINLLKAMELLSRARLSMYQSNFGLARQDVQIARDLLATVHPDAPNRLANNLDAVLQRLDMTLSNLPDFPVVASDDLDIAWQILLSGLPADEPGAVATGTPTSMGTPSATALASATPTPLQTARPSATP